MIEAFYGVADVDEHQVGFVADEGEEGGLMPGAELAGVGERVELGDGGGGDALLLGGGEGAPGLPVEAEELVEHGGAFEGDGYGWSFWHG